MTRGPPYQVIWAGFFILFREIKFINQVTMQSYRMIKIVSKLEFKDFFDKATERTGKSPFKRNIAIFYKWNELSMVYI